MFCLLFFLIIDSEAVLATNKKKNENGKRSMNKLGGGLAPNVYAK